LIQDIEGTTPKKKIKLSTQMITKYEINDTAAQMVKSINQTGQNLSGAGVTRADLIAKGITSRDAIVALINGAAEKIAASAPYALDMSNTSYDRLIAAMVAELKS
jgi:hypothetical protein